MKNKRRKTHMSVAATLLCGFIFEACALENAHTAPVLPRESDLPAIFNARAVDDEVLGRIRGGYLMPNGLVVSFGLERLVYVNGILSNATALTVTELGKIRGGSADLSEEIPIGTTLGLIQNGPGNIVGDLAASGGFATIIQNSADNQRIQAITTINTRVNSLEMMRSGRFGDSLRDSLTLR
jgi:hypothetical protein